jgi:hypothetical protein
MGLKQFFAGLALGAAMLTAGQASATIYNISASDELGTELMLAAGHYRISFIGIADGGAYDSAQVFCTSAGCDPAKWSNAFSSRDSNYAGAFLPGGSTSVDVFATGANQTYATAAAALAAYKAGPIKHFGFDINNGVIGAAVLVDTLPSPFVVSSDAETYRLVVTDPDGSRRYNLGGVSLDITAVPEPGTWTMMLLGVGLLGAALRRRTRPMFA